MLLIYSNKAIALSKKMKEDSSMSGQGSRKAKIKIKGAAMQKFDYNEFIHFRALAVKYQANGENMANLLDPLVDASNVPQIKNVCAKLSVELSDKIDQTSDLLGISKRRFIEIALLQMIEHSEHVLECVGTNDAIEDALDRSEARNAK